MAVAKWGEHTFGGWGSDRQSKGTSQWRPVAVTHLGRLHWRTLAVDTDETWTRMNDHTPNSPDGLDAPLRAFSVSSSQNSPLSASSRTPSDRRIALSSSQDTGDYSGQCTPAPLSHPRQTVLSVRLVVCSVPHGSDHSFLWAPLDSFPCTPSPPLLTTSPIPRPVLARMG